MSARNLAEAISRYLEADDTPPDAPSGSGMPMVVSDGGGRQMQRLAQKTDQLQQDMASMKQDMASLKSSMQMAALLPMLLNQSLTVVTDTLPNASPGPLSADETIEFKQADPLSALLPMLLMGGMGGGNGNGGTDNSSNMLLLVLALSGKL
jgi:hypothetical protein